MKKENRLFRLGKYHWHKPGLREIIYMLAEILFPRKIVTLGSVLILLVFSILFLMILSVLPTNFELLFLALVITAVGVSLWLIGLTGYIGHIRA